MTESAALGEAEAASILAAILGREVAISPGAVVLLPARALADPGGAGRPADANADADARGPLVQGVVMRYSGAGKGGALLAFPPHAAARIAAAFGDAAIGETARADAAHRAEDADAEAGDFDAMRTGILLEIGNVVLNAAFGALPRRFTEGLRFAVPQYFEGGFAAALELAGGGREDLALMVVEDFAIEAPEGKPLEARGRLVVLFPPASLDSMRALVPEAAHGNNDGF